MVSKKSKGPAKVAVVGPALPLSSWRLDHVPPAILDSIIDYFGWEAIKIAPHLYLYKPGDSLNNHRPLTGDLKNVSMVNWAFRHNVMGKQILHTISLHDVENMRKADESLTQQSRCHFRRLILIPPSLKPNESIPRKPWITARRKILKSLTNLEELYDHTGKIVRHAHVLPPLLRKVDITVQLGDHEPAPLQVTRLNELRIDTSTKGCKEHPLNKESQVFHKKVQAICKDIKEVDNLSLRIPGLPTCVCSHGPRFPEDKVIKDPLPEHLSSLEKLEVVVPFACIKPKGPRESHWWGYLGWILNTPVKFERLTIAMTWVPFTITSSNPTCTSIRDNMGLAYRVRDPLNPEPIPYNGMTDTLDKPLKDFIQSLFDKKPELQTFELLMSKKTQSDEDGPIQFRSVGAFRTKNKHKGKSVLHLSDQVHGLVVRDACEEVFKIFSDGFVPPPPHETRTRQEITEMFPFFDPALIAEVEEMRARVEGSVAERSARAATRGGGRSEVSLDFAPESLADAVRRQNQREPTDRTDPTDLSALD